MAWIFEDVRQCPVCAHTGRILVIRTASKEYKLSCGWCAHLSDPMTACMAFFGAWGAPASAPGDVIELPGVQHSIHGVPVQSPHVRVLRGEHSAFVMEKKAA
jgi:hypothetical protein